MHGLRVVFFSDLTRVFTTAGTSWAELGVDLEAALAAFCDGPHPAMHLTISYRAYLHICDSAAHMIIYGSCGAVEEASAGSERELVRQAITRQLAAGWPPYLRSVASAV